MWKVEIKLPSRQYVERDRGTMVCGQGGRPNESPSARRRTATKPGHCKHGLTAGEKIKTIILGFVRMFRSSS